MSIFLTILVAMAAGDAGASPELPPQVVTALNANAGELTDLHIQGSYQRQLLGDSQAALDQLGTLESEAEFTQKVQFELWLGLSRLKEQTRYPPSETSSPDSVSQTAFDSEKYYSGTANPVGSGSRGHLAIHNRDTLLTKEQKFQRFGTIFDLRYLHAAGFQGPQRSADLGSPFQSIVLERISKGSLVSFSTQPAPRQLCEVSVRYPDPWLSTRTTSIEDDPNLQLPGASGDLQRRIETERRTLVGMTRTVRFVLDPAMHYAVVEAHETRDTNDATMFITRNSDFIKIDDDLWLPRKCEITAFALGTRPAFTADSPVYTTTIIIDE